MQAQRREHHCLIASSMNTWWKCSYSSIRRDFSWSTSWIRLRYTRSCSFPQSSSLSGSGSGLLAGHRAGAMKSGVSQVNSCTVSRTLWVGALSCWKVKKPPPDRSLYWKPRYLCHRYLKINNSVIRYFLTKFRRSFADTFKNNCT